ncbi:MAG: hypothetical protein BWY85_00276 [Firmicutes bacterium ADurb.Bin506]|nr:MAG: hypothetical protein BWY85_00276 [Firmicutes bacterium ADurb.Bin506]
MNTAISIALIIFGLCGVIGTIGGKTKDARLGSLAITLASVAALVIISV